MKPVRAKMLLEIVSCMKPLMTWLNGMKSCFERPLTAPVADDDDAEQLTTTSYHLHCCYVDEMLQRPMTLSHWLEPCTFLVVMSSVLLNIRRLVSAYRTSFLYRQIATVHNEITVQQQ